ncbi:hypothetical protein QBC38DRAFT_486259 [Podospora fimiseda]|uniref:Uncharacterized protein n=1 Tax=Podospora fimiseda TaxID=252190 RepID=A0AAN7BIW5_9PEZI|nr:hypothetical protein QBC38DRAFT_486259 [Podospora fimiseda]
MTCSQYQANFCWVCKVMWINSQSVHLQSCRYRGWYSLDRGAGAVKLSDLPLTDYTNGWQADPRYDESQDRKLYH